MKFLAYRGNRITHSPDAALQFFSGDVKLLLQASNLVRVSQVNLVANGLWLDVAHLERWQFGWEFRSTTIA